MLFYVVVNAGGRPFCSAKLSIWIDSVNKFNSLLVERSVYIWDLETLQELPAEEANSIYMNGKVLIILAWKRFIYKSTFTFYFKSVLRILCTFYLNKFCFQYFSLLLKSFYC